MFLQGGAKMTRGVVYVVMGNALKEMKINHEATKKTKKEQKKSSRSLSIAGFNREMTRAFVYQENHFGVLCGAANNLGTRLPVGSRRRSYYRRSHPFR